MVPDLSNPSLSASLESGKRPDNRLFGADDQRKRFSSLSIDGLVGEGHGEFIEEFRLRGRTYREIANI